MFCPKLLTIVIHFNFAHTEVVIAGQKGFGVACSIIVTRRRSVGVTKIGVGPRVCVGVAPDVKIVSTTEGGTIAIVGVDSILVVSVHWCFEWLEVVFVTE